MILCWSVKGGSGTTVVAAALATLLARRAAAWFVDLAGDGPAVFGMAPGVDSTGVHEWMTSAAVTSTCTTLPTGMTISLSTASMRAAGMPLRI